MNTHKFMLTFITVVLISTVTVLQSISLNAQNKNEQNQALRTKERMDMIKKMKLIEVLGLEGERAEKFLLRYNSFDKKIEENRRNMRKATRELDEAISKNAKDITVKTNALINLQEEFNRLQVEKLRGMKSELSDIEYAKFVSFENKFVRELFGSFMGERRERGKRNANCKKSDSKK